MVIREQHAELRRCERRGSRCYWCRKVGSKERRGKGHRRYVEWHAGCERERDTEDEKGKDAADMHLLYWTEEYGII